MKAISGHSLFARWMIVGMLVMLPAAAAAADGVRFDFETGDMQGWRIVEGQFD